MLSLDITKARIDTRPCQHSQGCVKVEKPQRGIYPLAMPQDAVDPSQATPACACHRIAPLISNHWDDIHGCGPLTFSPARTSINERSPPASKPDWLPWSFSAALDKKQAVMACSKLQAMRAPPRTDRQRKWGCLGPGQPRRPSASHFVHPSSKYRRERLPLYTYRGPPQARCLCSESRWRPFGCKPAHGLANVGESCRRRAPQTTNTTQLPGLGGTGQAMAPR